MIRSIRSMSLLMGLVSSVVMAPIPSRAQSIPVLKKEWQGTSTATVVGAATPFHPRHKANIGAANPPTDWNAFQEARTLNILKQQGRHLEMALISPRGYRQVMVGTLSADGKLLQVVDSTRDLSLSVNGDKLSGCGSVRGIGGTFEHFSKNYSATCWDFTAVK